MILQTDKRLTPSINGYGCYYMSILFLANKHAGVELSTVKIQHYHRECVELGYIIDNDDYHSFVQSSEGIFRHLGLRVKYTQAHESPKRNCANNEIEILCLKNSNGFKHFVVGDGKGHIAYDPMGVSKGFNLHSKRIFKLL